MTYSKRRLIFVIDPHLSDSAGIRKDDMTETNIDKWEQLFELAKTHNADIFTTGDLTDKTNLKNKLMGKIIDLFNKNKDIKVFTIWGNHDEYQDNRELREESSMSVLLKSCENLIECQSADLNSEVLAIDFVDSYKIEEIIGAYAPLPKVMVTHTFYDNEFMGGKNDNITKEQAEKLAELGVQRLICGHDHEPHDIEFVNGMAVHRFGNLIRKNRKSYNSHRQIEVMLYDFETNNYFMLPIKHKPFIEVIKTEKLLDAKREEVEIEDIKELMIEFEGITTEDKFEDLLNKKLEQETQNVRSIVRKHI